MVDGSINCTLEDLADRTKTFELFRKSYRKNEAMEENRELLKEKYGRGKQLGINVNTNRQQIKDLTNRIEQIRKQNALRGMVDDTGEIIKTDEESKIQIEINLLKSTYQLEYNELKDLKTEIERI
jgi:kinesin family protein 6/9